MEEQCEKLRNLETATLFVKGRNVVKEDILKMDSAVSQICNGIKTMRQKLDEMKEQNNQCRQLLSLMVALDQEFVHMEKNVPTELIRDYKKSEDSVWVNTISDESINGDTYETPAKDCKKKLFNEPDVCPVLSYIDGNEFNTIPKYIIGRQSLETVNNLINTINQILKAKYTFLSLGKAHARRQGDLNLYLHYKKQDMDIDMGNEYVYFFTAEDYEKHTQSKLDKIKLNLITVLRHCKRLREYRIKNDIRYVILTKK